MTASMFLLFAAVCLSILSVGVSRDVPRGERTTTPQSASRSASHTGARHPAVPQRSSPINETSSIVVLVMPPDTNTTSFHDRGGDDSDAPPRGGTNKHRLIRGSKEAATITKTEYLKKDWCKTEPFQQIIHEEGCRRKRIMNKFCYGQCNSFFIPKSDSEDQDGGSFRSCAYCTPVNSEWVEVVLSCPYRTPPRLVKRVQLVTQCKCMAVNLDMLA